MLPQFYVSAQDLIVTIEEDSINCKITQIRKDYVYFTVLSGVLTEYDQTINGHTERVKLEKDQYEGLQRINISVGLRFNF